MRNSILLSILVCSLLFVGCNTNDNRTTQENVENKQVKQVEYYIELFAKPISDHEVKFDVKTNMLLPVEVMASVSLKNQKPDDTYIGYSKRIKLQNPNQSVLLNTASKNLPNGHYSAEIAFYPRWGAKNGNPEAAKIKTTIRGSAEIFLRGSGQAVDDVQQKNEMQKWVMVNVIIGTPWEKNKFIGKLGDYQEVRVTNKNPQIIKVYYFPKADMTIFVNAYKTSVTTWKLGKTSHL